MNEDENINNVNSPMNDIFNDDNNFSENKEMFIFMKEFFSKKNLKLKTEIPVKDVKKLTKIYFFALYIEKFDKDLSKIIKKVVTEFMTLQISKDRSSRKEFFEIFTKMREENRITLKDKLTGLLK